MTSDRELPELTHRLFDELAAGVRGISGVHAAIAERAFRAPGAAPARLVHDAVSSAVYGAIAGAGRLAGRGLEPFMPRRAVSDTPRGALLLGIVNGLIGDALEEEGSALALQMSAHVDRADATSRVAVFVHGLMETDNGWRLGGRPSYGDRLADDLGYTPVYVRYNSGRHISANGRDLAQLLQELVDGWPVEVRSLALVGHSMGGLVARSACHYAVETGRTWPSHVTHVVSLGTPHLGSHVAEFFHLLPAALGALPETRPLANFFRRRSAGVRDLRRGSLVDEDWTGRDPDALRACACREIPLLPGAVHCFVSASLAAGPLARLVGDALVLEASASGRGRTRRVGFDERFGHHVAGAGHFALLNHPDVYEKLRDWLRTAPARATLD